MTDDPMEFVARSCGFEDAAELRKMVISVDLRGEGLARFKAWQHGDGTKAGLDRLLVEQKGNGKIT